MLRRNDTRMKIWRRQKGQRWSGRARSTRRAERSLGRESSRWPTSARFADKEDSTIDLLRYLWSLNKKNFNRRWMPVAKWFSRDKMMHQEARLLCRVSEGRLWLSLLIRATHFYGYFTVWGGSYIQRLRSTWLQSSREINRHQKGNFKGKQSLFLILKSS